MTARKKHRLKLKKTATTGALDRTGRHHIDGCYSGSGARRRHPIYHGAGGGEGWRQRWSVYQYFPNKAAILFRLQQDEWEQTTAMLRAILQNPAEAPLQRVRTLVHAFLKSECDEAEMRVALSDSAPLYRDAPETEAVRAAGDDIVARYMQELLPQADAAHRALAGDLINSTLSAVGKEFSSRPRSAAEIVSYADAMADMFIAYLQQLGAAAPAAPAFERVGWQAITRVVGAVDGGGGIADHRLKIASRAIRIELNPAGNASATALARSAASRPRTGDLPPNSCGTCLSVPAALLIKRLHKQPFF